MNSPWYPASLTALYLYFVYNLGPKIMKKRPPMQLDTVIKLYDITQVILNLYVAIKVSNAYVYC
jgi:GNS1/SUR4 family.